MLFAVKDRVAAEIPEKHFLKHIVCVWFGAQLGVGQTIDGPGVAPHKNFCVVQAFHFLIVNWRGEQQGVECMPTC